MMDLNVTTVMDVHDVDRDVVPRIFVAMMNTARLTACATEREYRSVADQTLVWHDVHLSRESSRVLSCAMKWHNRGAACTHFSHSR